MTVKSSLLAKIPGIAHGFGDLAENVPEPFRTREHAPLWKERRPVWHQNHGVGVADVVAPQQKCGDVDALFTLESRLPVGVQTADCVPILLAHREGRAVAAVHAGWRGTRAHILRALWAKIPADLRVASEWVGAVGPAIGPCCYNVSEDLAKDFATEFSGFAGAVPKPLFLDLPAINAAELYELGFAQNSVDLIRACTQCTGAGERPRFHSYRREKGGTRQWHVIMRT